MDRNSIYCPKKATTIGRAELCFIFEAINAKIDDVLQRLGNEIWFGTRSQVWQ